MQAAARRPLGRRDAAPQPPTDRPERSNSTYPAPCRAQGRITVGGARSDSTNVRLPTAPRTAFFGLDPGIDGRLRRRRRRRTPPLPRRGKRHLHDRQRSHRAVHSVPPAPSLQSGCRRDSSGGAGSGQRGILGCGGNRSGGTAYRQVVTWWNRPATGRGRRPRSGCCGREHRRAAAAS